MTRTPTQRGRTDRADRPPALFVRLEAEGRLGADRVQAHGVTAILLAFGLFTGTAGSQFDPFLAAFGLEEHDGCRGGCVLDGELVACNAAKFDNRAFTRWLSRLEAGDIGAVETVEMIVAFVAGCEVWNSGTPIYLFETDGGESPIAFQQAALAPLAGLPRDGVRETALWVEGAHFIPRFLQEGIGGIKLRQ